LSPLGEAVVETGRALEGTTQPADEVVVELSLAAALAAWDRECAALLEPAGYNVFNSLLGAQAIDNVTPT
jgi:hypothetical protein